jgi:hypothetical protein
MPALKLDLDPHIREPVDLEQRRFDDELQEIVAALVSPGRDA